MRWRIVKTLVHKEALRHLTNRGGIALAMLLLVMALLMAAYGRSDALQSATDFIRGDQHCYIDYWEESPWVDYLKAHVPKSLSRQIEFRLASKVWGGKGTVLIDYPRGACAIQMRTVVPPGENPKIWCWYPGKDQSVMAPFENWFWQTTRDYYRERVNHELAQLGPAAGKVAALPPERHETWVWRELHEQFLKDFGAIQAQLPPEAAARLAIPPFTFERSPLTDKAIDMPTTIAAALVLFALFFVCVYLLPSLTCEERERGVLLAQALSPASPFEIVAAKLVFYPAVSFTFAAILGALTTPAVLMRPMFWLAILVLAFGSLGIGMTIACIAKTQRSASMTALCYMLIVSMLVIICQQGQIAVLPQFILEFHGPRLLSAAMTNAVDETHHRELGIAAALAGIWITIATIAFRRYGWQ